VEGEIWANLWQSDQLARINPATGEVTGYVNLAGILPASERSGEEDVLNGIAYDSATKRLLVTGKLWPTVFEIRVR
jgi:glutaminyl-peptide cyclotransferase